MGNPNEDKGTPFYSQGAAQMNAPTDGASRPHDAPPPGTPSF